MLRFNKSVIIRAGQDRVFQQWIDGNNWVKWFPDRFPSWKVLSTEGNVRTVEWGERWLGRTFKHIDKEVHSPPHRVEMDTISGSGKGSKWYYVFTKAPGGTKVEFIGEPTGAVAVLFGKLFRKKMERELGQVFEAFAKNLEE